LTRTMKSSFLALSSALLAASVWIPGSDSFLHPATLSLPHKTKSNTFKSNTINNMVTRNNDDMIAAQEAEAKKICPLIPPPEDPTATFEAAMG